jgi:hypothetical protein
MGSGMAATVEMAVVVIHAGLGPAWPQCRYHPKCSETENGMTQTARKRRLDTRHDPFPRPLTFGLAPTAIPYIARLLRSSGPSVLAQAPLVRLPCKNHGRWSILTHLEEARILDNGL